MTHRSEDAGPGRSSARALRVALVYLALGAAWILVSDRVLASLVFDPALLTRAQTLKGWVFVLLSAGLLWAMVRKEIRGLQEGERRFRALVEQSLAGVGVVQDGRVVYANPKLARIAGLSVSELMAERDPDPPAGQRQPPDVARLLTGGARDDSGGLRRTVRVHAADGVERPIEVALQDIQWRRRPATIAVVLDRSEEELLEQQLRHAQRMEAIGRLTGAVAHDFNNLLTAIHSPIEMAMADLGEDHPVHADLNEALDASRRASRLTRQLLTFSRKRVSRPRAIDLNETLRDLSPMVERLTGRAVTTSFDLGEVDGSVLIDPAQLEQVVVNLVVNAREAMPEGGSLTIRTRGVPGDPEHLRHRGGLRPGSHAVLEVVDTGHGMDADTRTHAFEPFFTTRERGTGLGLSTVFGVIRQADGFIRVESEPDQGTTMQVHLPLAAVEAEQAAAIAAEPVEGRGRGAGVHGEEAGLCRGTVLVAEDEASVRRVFQRVLVRAGYRVLSAQDAPSALRLVDAHEGDIDLLITDVMLPGMDGLELASELERRDRALPVLYVSGYSEEAMTQRLQARRGFAFLEKPFQVEQLLGAVKGVLDGERRVG